jgi:hypothetical protein
MLNFFRKIRKSFLTRGSFQKYFLYAIGEIALVVIGILIALQINNWNEWKQERVKEKEVLHSLAENLENNIKELENISSVNERGTQSAMVIMDVLENKRPYEDSLVQHFGYALNIYDSGEKLSLIGYESLKNTGIDIIQNKELKNRIINLYESVFESSKGRLDRNGKMYMDIINIRQDRFLRRPGFRFEPFNYDQLLRDDYFYSWLVTISDNRSWANSSVNKSLEVAREVLQAINVELKEFD